MFKTQITLSLLLILLTQISCNPTQTALSRDPSPNISTRDSNDALSPSRNELNEVDSNLIYGKVLSNIFYEGSDIERFPGFQFDKLTGDYWYCYRKSTVAPKYLDKAATAPGMTNELMRELTRINEQAGTVWNELGDKITAKSISGDEELEVIYNKAKKKYPKTKAVFDFSKIAMDQDGMQALLFVEYYSPERKLVGMYLLIPLAQRPDGSGFSVADSKMRAVLVYDAKRLN